MNDPIDFDVQENSPFETLPVEILWDIFARTKAMDLLHLYETCRRFQSIAPIVFQDKYTAFYDESFGFNPDWHRLSLDAFAGLCNPLRHLETLAITLDSNAVELLKVLAIKLNLI